MKFPIHNIHTARPDVAALLGSVQESLGFVPNVFGIIAESVPALKAFIELNNQFALSAFNATSREIIQIATSVENACTYCVAGHTTFAEMQNVPDSVAEALRNNQPIDDTRLEALNRFTRELVKSNGMVPERVLQDFLDAGYTPVQVIEVILGICVKMFSNLSNNVIGIPLDDEFAKHEWQPPANKPEEKSEQVA